MFSGSREQLTQLGFAQATVSTAAIALPSVPARCTKALITVEGQPVRWRDDGTAPTAAVGQPIAAGGVLEYEGIPSAVRVIRSGAADATLDVAYYR